MRRCVLLLIVGFAQGQLKIISPLDVAAQLSDYASSKAGYLSGATAAFGAPQYGESLVGEILLAKQTLCTDEAENLLTTSIASASTSDMTKLALTQRGECAFVEKARRAQNAGAAALIIVDSAGSTWTRDDMNSVILTDEGGMGSSIRIPTLMLAHQEGQLLIQAVAMAATAMPPKQVIGQLQWALPQESKVSVDFWTESGNPVAVNFLNTFALQSALIGHVRLSFTPHFYVFSMGAPESQGESDLCLKGDLSICSNPGILIDGTSVTGREVLEEDVRQLCILHATTDLPESKRANGIPATPQWWQYIKGFNSACMISSSTFNEECSLRVMKTIPGLKPSLQDCIKNGPSLLKNERINRAWGSFALRINGAKFAGQLDAVQLTRAVCTAFLEPPDSCKDVLRGHISTITDEETASQTLTHIASFLLVATLATVIGYIIYQRQIRKSMRAALRHEVMLEVRSQLQEYQSLDERGKRPLIGSMNVSDFSH